MKSITPENPYSIDYNLDNCDDEPIHLIQTVQSFAALIAADLASFEVTQVSTNLSSFLGISPEEALGKNLSTIFPPYVIDSLRQGIKTMDFSTINPIPLPQTAERREQMILIAHTQAEQLIIEVEVNSDAAADFKLLNKIDNAIESIQSIAPLQTTLQTLVKEIKAITDYDRVMIYKFDADYNGSIVAEEREEQLEPFLNIRYPATDIPPQARALFLSNRVRMLVDVEDSLSMITPSVHPVTQRALNVGSSAVRGVSPIHLEYLRNMGVRATLNVAIINDGKLWGLIACHHYQDRKALSYRIRNLIRFLGRIISGHITSTQATYFREKLLKNNKVHAELLKQMNEEQDLVVGLLERKYTLLDYFKVAGAVLFVEQEIRSIGQTPNQKEIQAVIDFLNTKEERLIFSTNCLSAAMQQNYSFTKTFAGLLAIKISESPNEYILWFRKEQAVEVYWGGNPTEKTIRREAGKRLSPRKSFAKWKQLVADQAEPWRKYELDAAILLRNNIREIILKRFNELKQLHHNLKMSYDELESFSYSVSHDLRSPLRAIEGFVQILKEDYSDKLDSYGIDIIRIIVENTTKMNAFINDILHLSKLAKVGLIYNEIEPKKILSPIIDNILAGNESYKAVKIVFKEPFPNITGDHTMIRQAFANLIENALKYSATKDQAYLHISGVEDEMQTTYRIEDNGIGMDQGYSNKIFDVFSRLVTEEEFEGSGIGLSIVKRIVERHQGKIWFESQLGQGTTFWVSFPKINVADSLK